MDPEFIEEMRRDLQDWKDERDRAELDRQKQLEKVENGAKLSVHSPIPLDAEPIALRTRGEQYRQFLFERFCT
ncbi:unnamed protein product [Caenorhabditis angaria]|uniref:Uncharacterized protein n=1 Tax=Caenorhabditis angaria TaxID=860376 RepID=A0A9P1NB69_9PELO|nr:unnamed protein product [Caenorhabditis angaria]